MRLNRKILLVTIATLALPLLVSSALNITSFRQSYTEALLTGSFGLGQSVNSVLNELLALGLPLDSLSGMDRKLAEVVEQNRHIRYIGVFDRQGRVIFHSDKTLIGHQFNDEAMRVSLGWSQPNWQLDRSYDGEEHYDVSIPVKNPDRQPIGVIRLGFPSGLVNDRVFDAVVQVAFNMIVTITVIVLILNLFLVRAVSLPVTRLSEYAQRITRGQFAGSFSFESKDEIGILSRALDHMAHTLSDQLSALRQTREELEDLVKARTQQLAGANATLEVSNRELRQSMEKQLQLTEQAHQSELALRESEERFRRMFEDSGDALLLLENSVFVECNQAAVDMLGYSDKRMILGKHPAMLSPSFQDGEQASIEAAEEVIARALQQGSTRFEWKHKRASGQVFPVEVLLTPIEYQDRRLLHVVWRDITERKQAEEQIHSLAFFDSLTGLANRRLLLDRLEQACIGSARSGQFGALMLLDLDHFKTLNDTLGHDVGDQLLVQVARRLQKAVREQDTVARLGGDEFVLMLIELGQQEQQAILHGETVAEKVRSSLAKPYYLKGQAEGYHSSSSIGLSLFQGHKDSAENLLKQADLALYQAKDAGRDQVRFFNPGMQARIESRTSMEKALRRALDDNELVLFYQPQLDGQGGLIGAEALVRWLPPGRPPVAPGDFIPLAEESGLIVPMGQRILELAGQQSKDWARFAGASDLKLAVNVSARQFHQPQFVDLVSSILRRTGSLPGRLKLEITESVVLINMEDIIRKMRILLDEGLSFALDDFGTGYSSLSYLKRLPVSQVKIDQSFVRDLNVDPNDAAIVRAILGMADSLGLQAIAEGVESEQQRDFLIENGCQAFQGYLFGKPLPADQFEARFLRRGKAAAVAETR